jgi:hypothetical protein
MKLSLILNKHPPTDAAPTACCARRIWELDPALLSVVTGVLLRREDVESLLRDVGLDATGAREEALRVRLLVGCTRRCALAERVERVLDGLTQGLRDEVASCPMMKLAERWSREGDRMTGGEAASLLWRLGTDARPHLERLTSRVSGELCVRAMRLLRDDRPAAGDAEAHARDVPAYPRGMAARSFAFAPATAAPLF